MGRCNNRRTQQAAEAMNNTPARARFSKGPTNKGRGAGGARGGGRGGRGGGGRDNNTDGGRDNNTGRSNGSATSSRRNQAPATVVQKIKQRVGSASTASNSATANTNTNDFNRLRSVDISKLDQLTLSDESVERIMKVLEQLNVVTTTNTAAPAMGNIQQQQQLSGLVATIEEQDGSGGGGYDTMGEQDELSGMGGERQQQQHQPTSGSYVEYEDDYNGCETGNGGGSCGNFINGAIDETEWEPTNHDDDAEKEDSAFIQELQDDFVFQYLTSRLCFSSSTAARACHAIQDWAAATTGSSTRTTTTQSSSLSSSSSWKKANDDASRLTIAMDWLCLHLDEKHLEQGFRPNPKFRNNTNNSLNNNAATASNTSSTTNFRAIPHPSISLAVKLTDDVQWQRMERIQQRVVGFHELGFHYADALAACTSTDSLVSSSSSGLAAGRNPDSNGRNNDEDKNDGSSSSSSSNLPAAIQQDAETLQLLLSALERQTLGSQDGNNNHNDNIAASVLSEEDMELARVEQGHEKEALTAIYEGGLFEACTVATTQSSNGGCGSSSGRTERYHVTITPEQVSFPSGTKEMEQQNCHLLVFLRPGYPFRTPLFFFYHAHFAPPLLRSINVELITQAAAGVGAPLVFEMVSYLVTHLPSMYEAYSLTCQHDLVQQQQADMNKKQQKALLMDKVLEEQCVTDGKLGRRQRARRKDAEKTYDRDEKIQQANELRREKQAQRLERIQTLQNTNNLRQTLADAAIEERERDRHEQEINKRSRAAMNAALNRDESVEDARLAAKKAEMDYRVEWGLLQETTTTDSTQNIETTTTSATTSDDELSTQGETEPPAKGGDTAFLQATPTTMAFMDRLRSLYSRAAEQKCTYGLREPTKKKHDRGQNGSEEDDDDSVLAIPRPVAFPVGDLASVLQDVVAVQQDQPWLISDDARAPIQSNDPDPLPQVISQREREMSRKLLEEHKIVRSSPKFGKMLSQRENLPAWSMRHEIVSIIAKNQVTVISGATGSGKTTQVPQFVLDEMINNGMGAQANMLVTQPRRISAIGVAERVAQERCESCGETVGYSIKLEKKSSKKTRLLLCTTGILLRRLQGDPDLASISHIFVDETHERDLNTDFLLIILKDLLLRRKSLKLILMSATLKAEAFSDYFGGCAFVSIPGRTHPVEEFRLEDILQLTEYEVKENSDYAIKKDRSSLPGRLSKSALRKLYYPKYRSSVIQSLSIIDETVLNYELLAELLEHICLKQDEGGAILVFLPGMMEIQNAIDEMRRKDLFQSSAVIIYPLHSSLSTAEQTAVFDVPPTGVRKIVVSTNISETSITIEDVVYVVDCGRVKELRQDLVKEAPELVDCWVSRASATQRRGRAGRVRPGQAYHMYSSHVHDMELQDYQLPEMLRVGVEELALQILILDLGEPVEFLSKAISPPSAQAMRNSLKLLEKLGAIECQWKDYVPKIHELGDDAGPGTCAEVNATAELTALGFHLATLPVEPRVGKLIIYGALFGCVDPTLTIAALMSSKNPFISSFDNRESADEARKHFATEGSDHLTVLSAFSQWKEIRASKGDRAASNFLKQNYLSRMTLWQIDSLRKQYAGILKDIGFLPNSFQIDGRQSSGRNVRPSVGCGANGNAENKALLKAILCAGLYPNVLIAPRSLVDGTSKKQVGEHAFQSLKGDVHLHPSTVSFAEKQMTGRYCVFHNIVKTSKMYVRDCTTVSPFALLLFGGALHVHHQQGVISVDDWLMFRFQGRKPPSLIKYLRSLTESMLLRKIISPEDDVTESPEGKALIQSISELLQREEPITSRNDGAEIVRPYHGPSEGSSTGMRNGQRGGHGGGRQHRGGGGRGRGGRGRGRNQQQT